MTISHTDVELIRKCTVQIFVSEKKEGFGFFVAPNRLLTCKHVVPNSEGIEIDWEGQKLSARVEKRCKDADLALLSVKLADHPYLPLNEDIVSFEALYVPGYTTLTVKGLMPSRILCNGTFQKSQEARSGLGLASSRCTQLHNNRYGVKGFAGDVEVIILQADGDDFEGGDSGTPLFNPRTRSICGLISGGKKETKTVHATHIKNALMSFPELAEMQNNIQKLPSNIMKIFMVHAQADEALLNELIQLLHDTNLTNLALYWKKDLHEDLFCKEDAQWPSYPTTFETAQIMVLLVSSIHYASDDYYENYVPKAWERSKSREARAIQALPPNVAPVVNWPQENIAFGEFAKGIREVIEELKSSNP